MYSRAACTASIGRLIALRDFFVLLVLHRAQVLVDDRDRIGQNCVARVPVPLPFLLADASCADDNATGTAGIRADRGTRRPEDPAAEPTSSASCNSFSVKLGL